MFLNLKNITTIELWQLLFYTR